MDEAVSCTGMDAGGRHHMEDHKSNWQIDFGVNLQKSGSGN